METLLDEALIRWSVRLAIACYLGRLLMDVGAPRNRFQTAAFTAARWLWTAGFFFYLVHVVCAFALVHHWSHQQALAHTLQQTEAVTGVSWGGGIYLNYLFTLFWLVDTVAWWMRGAQNYYRSKSYLVTVHCVFAFMIINATVVFGPPCWRWVALGVIVTTLVTYLGRKVAVQADGD